MAALLSTKMYKFNIKVHHDMNVLGERVVGCKGRTDKARILLFNGLVGKVSPTEHVRIRTSH